MEISHTNTLLPFRRQNFHMQLHYHLSEDGATILLGLFSIAAFVMFTTDYSIRFFCFLLEISMLYKLYYFKK